jgi:low affinity Fe/Cu permease
MMQGNPAGSPEFQIAQADSKGVKMRSIHPIATDASEHHAGGWFSRMANATAVWSGKPATFVVAALTVIVWGVTGPLFHYSDTWQLVINTGTTIVTFLMVFLIQNTQNRDTLALQVKLGELILALEKANNKIAAIEDASDEELEAVKEEVKARATEKRHVGPEVSAFDA